MPKEQLDGVKEQLNIVRDQLMTEDNDDLRQSIYSAFLEDHERGADMIIAFSREKELQLDASPEDVVQAIRHLGEQMNDDDISDIELTPEQLALVSGGAPHILLLLGITFFVGAFGYWYAKNRNPRPVR